MIKDEAISILNWLKPELQHNYSQELRQEYIDELTHRLEDLVGDVQWELSK